MPRGKPLRARRPDAPSVEREVKPMAPARTLHKATYSGTASGVAVEKDQKARPGKRTPTVAERAWMDWIVAFGCVACRMDGAGVVSPQVHHILKAGRRMGHLFTLPLCSGHHQHDTASGKVARHPYKARFEQRYGAEESLLLHLQEIYRGTRK